jgi:hypothetical protein
MKVKCNKCGYVGDESEFPKDRDFCQVPFIKGCPKCDNFQTPGDASMRMFPTAEHPFEYVRKAPMSKDSLTKTLHKASEAS